MARFSSINLRNTTSNVEDLFGEISMNTAYPLPFPDVPSATSEAAESLLLLSGRVAPARTTRRTAALRQLGDDETAIPRVAFYTQSELKSNPPPENAKVSHNRNKLTGNRIGDYEWYDSLPVRENWLAGNVPIRYSRLGELMPSMRFDRDTLLAYVHGCREQSIPLRVWVQNPPTTHSERYMSGASHLCRYTECPVDSRAINRGMLQVSLDEHPRETSNGCINPFFVAGCFHLFCLEEMISLPELMQVADVQADVRDLPLEEKNPMSLNREEKLLPAYNEWKEDRYNRYVRRGQAIPVALRRSERLVRFLMTRKVQNQPSTRQRKREERGGNDLTKHWGDLYKFVALNEKVRRQAREQKRAAAADSGRRRRVHHRNDDDDDDDDEGNNINVRSAKRACVETGLPSYPGWQGPSWNVAQPIPYGTANMAPGMYFPYGGALQPYQADVQSIYPPYDVSCPMQLSSVYDVLAVEPSEEMQTGVQTADNGCFIDPLLLQADMDSAPPAEATAARAEPSADDLFAHIDFSALEQELKLGSEQPVVAAADCEAQVRMETRSRRRGAFLLNPPRLVSRRSV